MLLYSLSYEYKESDFADQSKKNEYEGNGFLQTAFTEGALKFIAETTVDNSARSTNPDSNAILWDDGENEYACDNTEDKIFLLSGQEATTEGYGFAGHNKWGEGNTRIRVTTDYAKATEAYQDSEESDYGWWWLRSPYYYDDNRVRYVRSDGNALTHYSVSNIVGIVPALYIELQ